jgi:hypothetical protein
MGRLLFAAFLVFHPASSADCRKDSRREKSSSFFFFFFPFDFFVLTA